MKNIFKFKVLIEDFGFNNNLMFDHIFIVNKLLVIFIKNM